MQMPCTSFALLLTRPVSLLAEQTELIPGKQDHRMVIKTEKAVQVSNQFVYPRILSLMLTKCYGHYFNYMKFLCTLNPNLPLFVTTFFAYSSSLIWSLFINLFAVIFIDCIVSKWKCKMGKFQKKDISSGNIA